MGLRSNEKIKYFFNTKEFLKEKKVMTFREWAERASLRYLHFKVALYYLLLWRFYQNDKKFENLLLEIEEDIEKDLFSYGAFAFLRESRHFYRIEYPIDPEPSLMQWIANYKDASYFSLKRFGFPAYTYFYKKIGNFKIFEKNFKKPVWQDGYGGEKWAKIASLFSDYFDYRKITRRLFIDFALQVQHNGCNWLNKTSCNVYYLLKILDYNFNGNYREIFWFFKEKEKGGEIEKWQNIYQERKKDIDIMSFLKNLEDLLAFGIPKREHTGSEYKPMETHSKVSPLGSRKNQKHMHQPPMQIRQISSKH